MNSEHLTGPPVVFYVVETMGSARRCERGSAIVTASQDLALRKALEKRVRLKERLGQPTPQSDASDPADDPQPGTEMLVREAHRVLVRYRPGVALPDELCKVRAMLDAHMFGRDGRAHRDDAVRVARRIDRTLPA